MIYKQLDFTFKYKPPPFYFIYFKGFLYLSKNLKNREKLYSH